MKKILYPIVLFFLFSFSAEAQLNSVLLKDGAGVLISQHASIADAYNTIPATLSQAYVIELTSAYTGASEIYPITFTAKAGASDVNTITLRPEAGVASVSIAATSTGTSLLRLDDADYIIIDGRPGGAGTTRALTINNQGTGTTSYGIHLINGATNNVFRWFNVQGFFSASSGGRGIYIQTSANNPSGNSDNSFEFIKFGEGPRYHLNSSGTAANPNRNLYVYGCEFTNIKFAGWWQQAGTGKVIVDSCFFYSDMTGGGTTGTGVFGILSDFQSDTLIVTKNHMYNIDNSTNTTDVIGMSFRSFNAGSVLRVYNNMISMMAPNPSVDELFGIELGTNSMNNPVDAQIYFNTVRIGGTATGGTSGNVNSSAFSIDESNLSSTIDVRNNIFVNERTGGNEYHLAINITEWEGNITLDYNTYNSTAPDFAKYLTTVYNDFISYQTAIAPQEANSNDAVVQFLSTSDLHLAGSSVGDPALAGVNIPAVTHDFDNELRSLPYRGADEATLPGCFDPVLTHSVNSFTPTNICAGDTVGLAVVWNTLDTIPSIDIQWQFSTNGTSYSDIPGATSDTLFVNPTVNTYYRYKLTCQTTASSIFSAASDIQIIPGPTLLGINHTNQGATFNFVAVGSNLDEYFWDFGDGNTTTTFNINVSHTYTTSGNFTVTLIASNQCGDDTATVTILVSSIAELNSVHAEIFPNPASEFILVKAENITEVSIYTVKGELVQKNDVIRNNGFELNISELHSSVYFIKVVTTDGVAISKIHVTR